jgi:hypothetical protein
MTVIAIIVPLLSFALVILWMIKQGQQAKKEYRRRKNEEDEKAKAMAREDQLIRELGSYPNASIDQETPIEKALRGSGQSPVGRQQQSGHLQGPGRA